jgi:hypothetical protein
MCATGLLLAFVIAGCGDDNTYTNRLRPPEQLVVSAYIAPSGVSISPNGFGAGPITIVITNQTERPQQFTVETAGPKAGIKQTTGPINPTDTADMKITVLKGRYRVAASGKGIKPTALVVGSHRPSSQNDLGQP